MTPPLHRREFLAQASAAAAAAAVVSTSTTASAASASAPPFPKNELPTGPVQKRTLGKTGVQVSLIGMGTGSIGSGQASNQTRLGIKEFTRVVRHALDHGVNFFDVADQYGSHVYLREALKGVPRDQYVIQTKTHATNFADAKSHLERYRLELGVDYIDVLLLHCMTKGGWQHDHTGAMDYLRRAKTEGLVRAHGTSCHGMDPLKTSAGEPFVEVDLARINPEGLIMDDKSPDEVVPQLEAMHAAGKGVVGMKIFGEGRINTAERKNASLRFVLSLGTVDAFIIGFETPDQIDDAIARTSDAIQFLKQKS
jgi:aryl-alcohol dehydrogenase-like predicted oxidoreductase